MKHVEKLGLNYPENNLGAWARFGGLCPPGPNIEPRHCLLDLLAQQRSVRPAGAALWWVIFSIRHSRVAYSRLLCAHMTSSTKPEVHNVSQRCQRKTEPRLWESRVENLVKFSRVVPEMCIRKDRQTDGQTDRPAHANTALRYRDRLISVVSLAHSSPLSL